MKAVSVLQAQSMRVVRMLGDFPHANDLMMALQEKYSFMGIPSPEEVLSGEPNIPMTFKVGKYQCDGREILVDFLQIYRYAVAVTTRTNTVDSDLILQDALTWAATKFRLEFEPIRPGILHNSQLEVRLEEKSLADLFPALREIGVAIASNLDEFWPVQPPYELIALTLWFDKSKFPPVIPAAFRLDRREGTAFEDNLYWSEAPMSTDNHLTVLSRLEQVCLERLK